jgi:hypothetical protein
MGDFAPVPVDGKLRPESDKRGAEIWRSRLGTFEMLLSCNAFPRKNSHRSANKSFYSQKHPKYPLQCKWRTIQSPYQGLAYFTVLFPGERPQPNAVAFLFLALLPRTDPDTGCQLRPPVRR